VGTAAAQGNVEARSMTIIVLNLSIVLAALIPVGLLVFAVSRVERRNPAFWIPIYLGAALVGAAILGLIIQAVPAVGSVISVCQKMQNQLISTLFRSKTVEPFSDVLTEIAGIYVMFGVGPCTLFLCRKTGLLFSKIDRSR
jgi:hypothetical protein